MVGWTRTKPHHNDTLIASAHLSKYTSISLACWGATHAPPQAYNVRHFAPHEGRAFLAGGCCTSSASSSSSCGCQRHARWPSLFHLEGCNTTHMTVASSSPRSASGSHSTSSAPAGRIFLARCDVGGAQRLEGGTNRRHRKGADRPPPSRCREMLLAVHPRSTDGLRARAPGHPLEHKSSTIAPNLAPLCQNASHYTAPSLPKEFWRRERCERARECAARSGPLCRKRGWS